MTPQDETNIAEVESSDPELGNNPYSISVSKTSTPPGDDGGPATDVTAIRVVLPGTASAPQYRRVAFDFGSLGVPANYTYAAFTVVGNDKVATLSQPNFGSTTWVDIYVEIEEGGVISLDYIVTISKMAITTTGYTFVYNFDPANAS